MRPGDRLPLVPQHRLKAGAEYRMTPKWKLGADLVVTGDQYLRGDEANQNPKIAAYWLVNLNTSYDLTENLRLFAVVQNLFDKAKGEFGYGAQWAGQGAPLARQAPAAEMIANLRRELERALSQRLTG